MKVILPVIAGSMLLTLILGVNTSILADEVTFSAELEDSLGITLSDNDVTLSINPGASPFSTGSVTSTVYTNAQYGYTLSVSSDSTSLTRTTSLADGTNPTIPALATREGGYSQTDFTVNSWGYNKGSGNWLPFTGLFELISSDGTTNADTATLNFAVKADYTQPSGVYSISLTFTLIANIPSETRVLTNLTYMQDINDAIVDNTEALASKTLIDSRDNSEYQVVKIGNKVWMVEDLRIDGTIPAEGSNFTGGDIVTSNTFVGSTGLPVAKSGISTSNTDTTWYNLCAATAADANACQSSGYAWYNAGEDICPAGWKLPTLKEYNNAWSNAEFNPTVNGTYKNNQDSMLDANQTNWWTTTNQSSGMEYYAYYNGSSFNRNYSSKSYGYSIRCVAGTRTIDDITLMQEVSADIVQSTQNGATATLADERMGLQQSYLVKKIDGKLWMAKNLMLGDGANINGNFTGDTIYFDYDYYETWGEYVDPSGSFTSARGQEQLWKDESGHGMTEVYNFCAAGAANTNACSDSLIYSSDTDICPRNWRMPTVTEFEGLFDNMSEFAPVEHAYEDYSQGGIIDLGYGDWWSATATNGSQQKALHWDGAQLSIIDKVKSGVSFMRCVSKY